MQNAVEKMASWALKVVLAMYAAHQLPQFTRQVQMAQAKLLWESRASNWGNPNHFIFPATKSYGRTH